MMDLLPFLLLAWLVTLVLAVVLTYWFARKRGYAAGLADGQAIPSTFKDELMDLRHVKDQLDNPPQHHEHVWARKPDVHKLGWQRFRCTYKDCLALDWRADKVNA